MTNAGARPGSATRRCQPGCKRAQSSQIWADDGDAVTPHSAAPIGGSVGVLSGLPVTQRDVACQRSRFPPPTRRDVVAPEGGANANRSSMMRANVPAAGSQILPRLVHAVCGMTVRPVGGVPGEET